MPQDTEIERKYLLRSLPSQVSTWPSATIDQGYLPGERILERVRRITASDGVRFYRTVKLGAGIQRFEFEEDTTEQFFTTVWPLTRSHRVHKRRYSMSTHQSSHPTGWVIDEFVDRPLVLAELELESADAVVTVPEWLAAFVEREVTDEPDYTNFRLAR